MSDLTPTPELIAAARRAASGQWTVGSEGILAEKRANPHLGEMAKAGLVELCAAPVRLPVDDRWALTDAGRQWLAANDKENRP